METTHPLTTPDAETAADALVDRLFEACVAAFDVFAVYLGDRLGFYAALAQHGPMTPPELATATDTAERYVREWLEQQATTGLLTADDPALPASARRFALPPGHDAVLADGEDLRFLTPLAQVFVGAAHPLEQLVEVYRTGEGVPYAAYGANLVDGQGRMNRNFFLQQLGPDYLAQLPGLADRLNDGGHIADIGCGVGWSSIGLAKAFPGATVDGFDLDALSVNRAQDYIRDYGLEERVQVRLRDIAAPGLEGQYDLVLAVECVHDMGDPVAALRSMRRLAKPGAIVLIVDERVAETFTPNGDLIERMMYGWSILHCLPVGIADCPGGACAATGTVMRTDTLRGYAHEAGFQDVEVLPLDNDLFRFYRLIA
ncbi:MAG: methyltransferase domain-containing protein [Rhodothermaceae bacterium]|nr:methyltransferase domain-containing protein [Rhodothermaceae bacterium]